jgi:hypothetical protein
MRLETLLMLLYFSSLIIFLIFEINVYQSKIENYFKILKQKHAEFNHKKSVGKV